ncbi:MAG: hypothetical protein BGO51_07760 [Rhodospirillales bacterium 69-11]|nr:hypothetical protein [Rhodospirillales bacterium]OJW24280.1 MAG: hypothetical protein BGO51_07760 [Rhodospirillales bacterium 69-11]
MADTVSAASAWVVSDTRLSFLAPQDLPAVPDDGAARVAGAIANADPLPGLIVNFTTLAPDANGWLADPNGAPASISGYAAVFPDSSTPVIVGALGSN